jgi:hypothetical protein
MQSGPELGCSTREENINKIVCSQLLEFQLHDLLLWNPGGAGDGEITMMPQ